MRGSATWGSANGQQVAGAQAQWRRRRRKGQVDRRLHGGMRNRGIFVGGCVCEAQALGLAAGLQRPWGPSLQLCLTPSAPPSAISIGVQNPSAPVSEVSRRCKRPGRARRCRGRTGQKRAARPIRGGKCRPFVAQLQGPPARGTLHERHGRAELAQGFHRLRDGGAVALDRTPTRFSVAGAACSQSASRLRTGLAGGEAAVRR